MATASNNSSPARLSERVSALPVVGKAFDTLSSAYDRYGKHSKFSIVRQSVETVEHTLEGRLSTVEHLVCAGLDRLETGVASVAAATASTAASGRHLAQRAADIATATREAVTETARRTPAVVHERAAAVQDRVNDVAILVESKIATLANSGVNIAESVVDRIPAAPEEPAELEAAKPETIKLGTASLAVAQRVRQLSGKARARIVAATFERLHHVQHRSQEAIETLQANTVNLLQYAQEMASPAGVRASASNLFTAVQHTSEHLTDSVRTEVSTLSQALRRRLHDLSLNRNMVVIFDIGRHVLETAQTVPVALGLWHRTAATEHEPDAAEHTSPAGPNEENADASGEESVAQVSQDSPDSQGNQGQDEDQEDSAADEEDQAEGSDEGEGSQTE
eukprot:m.220960 g.220960  ORF g.220960 m.220960 type:complete len:394 (-) comp10486_c0_seq1:52-1233(-)